MAALVNWMLGRDKGVDGSSGEAAVAGDVVAHTGVTAVDDALDPAMPLDRIVLRPITLPDGNKRTAFVLENVLTNEECKALMAASENVGYRAAMVSVSYTAMVLDKDYRDSDRCMVDSTKCTEEIFRRVRPFLPEKRDSVRIAGLNERLRFLRYRKGNKFAPHYDASFRRRDANGRQTGEFSFYTIMIYLNSVQEGGSTRFLGYAGNVDVNPQPGMVLIFDHDIYHQGSEVTMARNTAFGPTSCTSRLTIKNLLFRFRWFLSILLSISLNLFF